MRFAAAERDPWQWQSWWDPDRGEAPPPIAAAELHAVGTCHADSELPAPGHDVLGHNQLVKQSADQTSKDTTTMTEHAFEEAVTPAVERVAEWLFARLIKGSFRRPGGQ